MDGANTPGVPANLHKCPGVAQAAATSLERAESPIPANHAFADTFALDIFGSHADQGIFGKPHPLYFGAGPLKHCTHSVRPARKSVVEGKRVSVSVDLGGRRVIKKKNQNKKN